MRRAWALLIAIAVFVIGSSQCDAGLIINLINNGGTAPTTTGTGALSTVMRAAADVWEQAFYRWSFAHTLTLEYRWIAIGTGGVLAQHGLLSQGGSPNREDYGMIDFDNDGSSSFFLDGTLDTDTLADLIASSSEYSTYTEADQDFGVGSINRQRLFTGASGAAASRIDAFSVALHEIGHALGLSNGNSTFQSESSDGDVDVVGPMPFAGSTIATTGSHINVSNTLMSPSISTGTRKLPSAVDILANAQLSQFTDPNLNLDAQIVPEPSSLLLASILGGCGIAFRVRRRRVTAGSKSSAA